MDWIHDVSCFFGGAFLANAVPHLVSGLTGRPFQTPFARPPGQGLSSSTVNVLWGWLNIAIAYWLVGQVGTFDLHSLQPTAAMGLGGLLVSCHSAHWFGRFHGGNAPMGPAGAPPP